MISRRGTTHNSRSVSSGFEINYSEPFSSVSIPKLAAILAFKQTIISNNYESDLTSKSKHLASQQTAVRVGRE